MIKSINTLKKRALMQTVDKNMIITACKRLKLTQKPRSPELVKWDLESDFQILNLPFTVYETISLGLSSHTSNMGIPP